MNKSPIVIGIAGLAGAGKDEVGGFVQSYLEEHHRDIIIKKLAFADELKKELAMLLSDNLPIKYKIDWEYEYFLSSMYNRDSKELFRPILQFWGTEYRRNNCGVDYWIGKIKNRIINNYNLYPSSNFAYIITDVRFDNEAEFIDSYTYSALIHVMRDVVSSKSDSHASEQGIKSSSNDYKILNNGTLEDLRKNIYTMMQNFIS